MSQQLVGILGASSLVGHYLLPLCVQNHQEVVAFSRQRRGVQESNGARWRCLSKVSGEVEDALSIPSWVCLAPIWVLPDYFDLLLAAGARKVVVLSSNSRFSKQSSSSESDRVLAARLAAAERQVQVWAEQNELQWVILRSMMIYGAGLDRNVSDIARFVWRWRFFPLIGNGCGLRQPVHAGDVAAFCIGALECRDARNLALDICGGETLDYREMVRRIGDAMGLTVRFVAIPRVLLRAGVWAISRLPRFQTLSPALVDRMTRDLIAEGTVAEAMMGIRPRRFLLSAQDLPFSNKRS